MTKQVTKGEIGFRPRDARQPEYDNKCITNKHSHLGIRRLIIITHHDDQGLPNLRVSNHLNPTHITAALTLHTSLIMIITNY